MGHAAVGVPVLNRGANRQPFQEALHIEDRFQIGAPGFRVGGALFRVQRFV